MLPDWIQTLKIVRKCPRCHRSLYHRARLYRREGPKGGYHVQADCADCGHPFRPRFIRDEWNLD